MWVIVVAILGVAFVAYLVVDWVRSGREKRRIAAGAAYPLSDPASGKAARAEVADDVARMTAESTRTTNPWGGQVF